MNLAIAMAAGVMSVTALLVAHMIIRSLGLCSLLREMLKQAKFDTSGSHSILNLNLSEIDKLKTSVECIMYLRSILGHIILFSVTAVVASILTH